MQQGSNLIRYMPSMVLGLLWVSVGVALAQPTSLPTTKPSTQRTLLPAPHSGQGLATRMQRRLPAASPLLLSLRPEKVSQLATLLSPALTQRLLFFDPGASQETRACMFLYASVRFFLRARRHRKQFLKACTAAVHARAQMLLSPYAMGASNVRKLWLFGSLRAGSHKEAWRLLKAQYATWLVPAKRPMVMQRAWEEYLASLGIKRWNSVAKGAPPRSLIMRSDQSYWPKRVAMLIPRKGFLQVMVSYPVPPGGGSWQVRSRRMRKGLIDSLSLPRATRITRARRHFFASPSALGLYIHGDRMLQAGTSMGLSDALGAVASAVNGYETALFGVYSSLAAIPKLLMATQVAHVEDASVALLSKPHLSLQVVQSLTEAGRQAYLVGKQANAGISVKGGPFLADFSLRLDVAGLLRRVVAPLPWMYPPVHLSRPQPRWKELVKMFKNCGITCTLTLAATGSWNYLKAVLDGLPQAAQRVSLLPGRLRFVVLPPLPGNTNATRQRTHPRAAMAAELSPAGAAQFLAILKPAQKALAKQGWTLTHSLVTHGKARCVMVGLNQPPSRIFGKCQPTKHPDDALYRLTLHPNVLRNMLPVLPLFGRQFATLLQDSPRLLTAKTTVQAVSWREGHTLIHQLRWCRKGCAALTRPKLATTQAQPLPTPKQWPPQGAELCLWQARALTYKLNGAFDNTTQALLPILKQLRKQMQRPLQCLRQKKKYQQTTLHFESLWEAAFAYAIRYQLVHHSPTKWSISYQTTRRTFLARDTLYPAQGKSRNLTLVLKDKGVTFATRGLVIPRYCNLKALAGHTVPLAKRLTCPQRSNKPDVRCITQCIKRLKKLFPSLNTIYVYPLPHLQHTYQVATGPDGKLTPLTKLLWVLSSKVRLHRKRAKWTVLKRYHQYPKKPWTYIYSKEYKALRNKRAKSTQPRRNSLYFQVLRQKQAQMKHCYENQLKQTPQLRGKIVFQLFIATSGRIDRVQIEINQLNAQVARCIKHRLLTLQLPPGKEPLLLVLPFHFSPR